MIDSNQIRQKFLDYFAERDHALRPSSPLVPKDDPTLLFTNAGMVQFKRVFLGEERRPYVRAATSQKCVRAGGKHNDIENVGFTERHHTFFEMLGNFSFGDYFKREAIRYAWELLTDGCGLPKELLWATVYEEDDEAYALWRDDIGLPEARIARMGAKDNFWAMGDTGPCGPCSEITLDQGPEVGCRRPECDIHCDCDRYLELWNLVFMQFSRDESGKLSPLPRPSIDTGMGLERIAAVMQGKKSNYGSDLFAPIIAAIERVSGERFGAGGQPDAAFKVISDHARAIAFLIADGVLPSNEGRGYVLRRILRRAVRFGRLLGLDKPFLAEVCDSVRVKMEGAYPELTPARTLTGRIVTAEEERFSETLDVGLRLLSEELARLRAEQATVIPGELIFRLYDTYGFPIDIINDVARTEGLAMDLPGFERHMERQKEMARQAGLKAAEAVSRSAYRRLLEAGERTGFVGYHKTAARSAVLLVAVGEAEVAEAGEGQEADVICAETPFYGEAGGQVGDAGRIIWPGGEAEVTDTLRSDGLTVHRARILRGVLKPGQEVRLEVDSERRQRIAYNHTATHILQAVLRRHLGEHVKQAGSLVAPDRLRFDFTHFAAIEPEVLQRIEDDVNAAVRRDMPVLVQMTTYDEAVRSGAMALFEDKYAEEVRLLSIEPEEGGEKFSQELCGGTHTRRTGEVGLFKIVSEGGIAAGVRRIEAVTGPGALELVRSEEAELRAAADLLKAAPNEVAGRIEKLLANQKRLERELERARTSGFGEQLGDLIARGTRQAGEVSVTAVEVPAANPKELREMADRMRDRVRSGVVVLGARSDSKAMLVATVSKDLTGRYSAADIVKRLAELVGGTGGGRPDMAQAGSSHPERLSAAIDPDRVRDVVLEVGQK